MNLKVNGKSVAVDEVTYRELNHGQSVTKSVPFEAIIPKKLINSRFNGDFEQFRKELKQDYELTGDTEPQSFFRAGFPCLNQLIENHLPSLEEIVKEYLFIEFWESVLPKINTNHTYVINEVTSLDSSLDDIVIRGAGFFREG